LRDIKLAASQLELIKTYVSNLKTTAEAINLVIETDKNRKTPQGWFKIAQNVLKLSGTPVASIFKTYLDVGTACLNKIKQYENMIRPYQLTTGLSLGDFKVKIKVVEETGGFFGIGTKMKEYDSGDVASNIKLIIFHYKSSSDKADFAHLTAKPCTINSDGLVSLKNIDITWPYQLNAILEIHWKNGKVFWVPFNNDFVDLVNKGNVNGEGDVVMTYGEITFQSYSGADMANKINLIPR
jgi:hypothetical protein